MVLFLNRSAGLLVFEVLGANPNGDPDWDNRPRMLSDGRGFISDVSVKAKIRRLLATHDTAFFEAMREKFAFQAERFHILESLRHGTDLIDAIAAKNEVMKLAADPVAFINRFWDARLFGTTFLQNKDDLNGEDDSEDEDAPKVKKAKKVVKNENGEQARKILRTGCVTLTPAFSLAPIEVVEATITKQAPLREDVLKKDSGDMAPQGKKFVVHGVYVARMCVNPILGKETLTSNEDIEVMKAVLPHIFSLTASACRPGGSINFLNIYWKDHKNQLGSFRETDFWNKLTPVYNGTGYSKGLQDYTFPKNDDPDVVDLMN